MSTIFYILLVYDTPLSGNNGYIAPDLGELMWLGILEEITRTLQTGLTGCASKQSLSIHIGPIRRFLISMIAIL